MFDLLYFGLGFSEFDLRGKTPKPFDTAQIWKALV